MRVVETKHRIGDEKKHALRILNEDKFDTIHLHMKEGETLTKHHAKCDVLIIVRTGKVVFNFEQEKVTLTNEEVLHMKPFEDHSVEAIEESDFLIVKVK